MSDLVQISGQWLERGSSDIRQAIRDRCFPIWAWECQQSSVKLRERIQELWGEDVDDRLIRYWAKRDGWRLRYESERLDIDPLEARPAIAMRLQSAAMGAAVYLDAVNNGEITPDKDRTAAAKIALDAAGFASIHITGAEAQASPTRARERTDYKHLTTTQLADRMRALRSGSSIEDTSD